MRLISSLFLAAALPGLAMAAGGDSTAAPTTTQTTKTCKGVQVWDKKTQKCVNPQDSSLGADTLMQAVRELAYAGRHEDAQDVLRAMPDPRADLVLTYWGFTHRKMGNLALADMFYRQAIAQNPGNILARSYMAQGFVAEGRTDAAIAQWREIIARGGKGTWAEASLREAIRTGTTYSY